MEIFFDGACAPFNPGGIATFGYVIRRGRKLLDEGFGRAAEPGTPEATSNVAEYTGLIKALRALESRVRENEGVWIYGDSQLVINQLLGTYQVRAAHLIPLYSQAKGAIEAFKLCHTVCLKWVGRDQNQEADRLSQKAISNVLKGNHKILEEVVIGVGKHKGTKFKDLPQSYRNWLWSEKKGEQDAGR